MIADSTTLTPIIEIFGAQSQLVTHNDVAQELCARGLTAMIDYKILVLGCMASYAVLLYYFRGYISALMKIFVKTSYTEKLMEEQGFLFAVFLRMLSLIGVMAMTIFVVKLIDINFGAVVMEQLPVWSTCFITLATLVAVFTIQTYRNVILDIIGRIGSIFMIANPLKRLITLIFGVGAVVITPVILLLAFSSGTVQNIVFYIVVMQIVMVMFFLLYKTYMLFIEQSVSNFYWFLYLCIVETFPITLFMLMVLRGIG